jgi:hypothetical protein
MWWTLGFVVAGIVVAVVAVLLLGILMQARRIRTLAGAAVAVHMLEQV